MSFRAAPDDIRDLLALARLVHPELEALAREVHDATGFDGGGWNSGHCRELLALADALAHHLTEDHQRTADWLELKANQADIFDNPDFALSWEDWRGLIGPIAPDVAALQLSFDERADPFALKVQPWEQAPDQYESYAAEPFGLAAGAERPAGLLPGLVSGTVVPALWPTGAEPGAAQGRLVPAAPGRLPGAATAAHAARQAA